jgi:hypothetical protein
VLVTLPEETPVNEAVETAFHLEDRAAVMLGPVVVNGLWPPLDLPATDEEVAEVLAAAGVGPVDAGDRARLAAAASFRLAHQSLQQEQVGRLADQLPLPQLRLPYLFDADLGPAQVEALAHALGRQLAPSPP